MQIVTCVINASELCSSCNLSAAAFLVGEYGRLVAGETPAAEQFALLRDCLAGAGRAAKGMLLTALLKVEVAARAAGAAAAAARGREGGAAGSAGEPRRRKRRRGSARGGGGEGGEQGGAAGGQEGLCALWGVGALERRAPWASAHG